MKLKKLATIAMTVVSVAALAACGSKSDSKKEDTKKEANIVTEIKDDTTITFWHAMNGAQEKALTKITEDFQKANPKIKVTLQNQQDYGSLQAKVNSTLQSPKDLPTISQAYPGWLYDASENKQLVDLTPYMEDKTIGWGDQEKIKESLLDGAKINDVQYGIPFNKSTEALFYNETILKQYGVKVPTTMEELKEASKTIYEKSEGKVVGAGFDALSNYYLLGMKNEGVDVTKDTKFDSKESKDVVNYYADGVKDGYFRTPGSDKYMSVPFASQKVAMFVGSIAGETYVAKDAKSAGFEYGVAVRPAKYNIQQGTDVYMFSSATDEQKTAAFLFMKYLSTPDVQLYWAQNTGYMPILDSVIKGKEYQASPNTKIPSILEKDTENLISFPVTQNSNAALNNTVRTIMENILSNSDKGDRDKMFTDGAKQLEDAWNQ
ncbi:sugar ABC transporter substrate-binding protein [Floricoccus tropicus]|uniref:Sugar ABC transporter substrate-binding protein n=1 Tax=Floricoccus tropicus TaxID=1859473 RepID=A0A1E8GKP1_9LACT|nr:extracellular solute-binding protein [Floricoccus tropicus]OFI48799.1 sugar ABC transporter substrate-binding protein [Floricoccus tropicus]